MILQPANLEDLQATLAAAHARGEQIAAFDLGALARILEHRPEDMTVTTQAGLTLAALQAVLARQGQWLPVDAPRSGTLTIGALLAANANGPRRLGYGTVRDHLLGIAVVLPDGRLIRAGGKVVKNVAGYDLGKLFIGSRGSLGVIVEATFKLRPLPEAEQFVQARCESLAHANSMIEAILAAAVTPVVLDLHNASSLEVTPPAATTLVLGFAGTREEVAWQVSQAREIRLKHQGHSPECNPTACEFLPCGAELEYERAFWSDPAAPHRWSVPPSRVTETIHGLGSVRFVARAGNGVIYYRGGPTPPAGDLARNLLRRVKDTFDPKHILPNLPC